MFSCVTIDSSAVRTDKQLSALLIDLLGHGLPGRGREGRPLEDVQECLSISGGQQNTTTRLEGGGRGERDREEKGYIHLKILDECKDWWQAE